MAVSQAAAASPENAAMLVRNEAVLSGVLAAAAAAAGRERLKADEGTDRPVAPLKLGPASLACISIHVVLV